MLWNDSGVALWIFGSVILCSRCPGFAEKRNFLWISALSESFLSGGCTRSGSGQSTTGFCVSFCKERKTGLFPVKQGVLWLPGGILSDGYCGLCSLSAFPVCGHPKWIVDALCPHSCWIGPPWRALDTGLQVHFRVLCVWKSLPGCFCIRVSSDKLEVGPGGRGLRLCEAASARASPPCSSCCL